MKINKKKSILFAMILFFAISLGWSNNVSAIPPIIVGGESLEDGGSNAAGTATIDLTNFVLTLNNYNGGVIEYLMSDDLKIVLNGTNTITAGADDDYGFSANDANLLFTGNGTLLIKDAKDSGIYIEANSLEINSTSITIDSPEVDGIYLYSGDVKIKDSDVTIINPTDHGMCIKGNFAMDGGALSIERTDTDTMTDGIYVKHDFVLNDGTINIDNALEGIAPGNFKIQNGNIRMGDDIGFGIIVHDTALINGGNLSLNTIIAGIVSQNYLEINGGRVEIDAGNEGTSAAIVVAKTTADSDFKLADNMLISPEGISLQNASLDFTGLMDAITIGTPGATITLSGLDVVSTNTASKVTIFPALSPEENPDTYDGVVVWILLGGISAIGTTFALSSYCKRD